MSKNKKKHNVKVRFKNGDWVKIYNVTPGSIMIKKGVLFIGSKAQDYIINWDNVYAIEELK